MSREIISGGTTYYSTTDDNDVAVLTLCHVNNGFVAQLSDATKEWGWWFGIKHIIISRSHPRRNEIVSLVSTAADLMWWETPPKGG